MVVDALLAAVSTRPALDGEISIAIKYFETGHSMMEADGMHGLIERAGRGVELGTPDSYYTLFQKVKTPKYTVKMMDFTNFLNFSELSERAIGETCLICISQWHTIRLVKAGTAISMAVSKNYEVDLRQVSWRRVGAPANFQLINAACDKPQRVSRLKLKDCLELVDKLANHRVVVL